MPKTIILVRALGRSNGKPKKFKKCNQQTQGHAAQLQQTSEFSTAEKNNPSLDSKMA